MFNWARVQTPEGHRYIAPSTDLACPGRSSLTRGKGNGMIGDVRMQRAMDPLAQRWCYSQARYIFNYITRVALSARLPSVNSKISSLEGRGLAHLAEDQQHYKFPSRLVIGGSNHGYDTTIIRMYPLS